MFLLLLFFFLVAGILIPHVQLSRGFDNEDVQILSFLDKFVEARSIIIKIARESVERQLLKTFLGMKLLMYEVYQLVHRGGRAADVIEVYISDFPLEIYVACYQLLESIAAPLHGAPEHV